MSVNAALISELDHELGGTRRTLQVIPAEKADFKPHPKSFSLGDLAVHISNMYRWTHIVINSTEMDLADPAHKTAGYSSTEALLKDLDEGAANAKTALESATAEQMQEMWTLRFGDHVIVTLPRAVFLRLVVFNHIIHHRAQLTVYLRLLDLPVPGLYGPSADEG